MQFTLIAPLLTAAAALTSAAPAPAPIINARSSIPHVRAFFYDGGGCSQQGIPLRKEDVFTVDHPIGKCIDVPYGPFGSTYFNESSLTHAIRFFNQPCSTGQTHANYFQIGPNTGASSADPAHSGTPGCFAQGIKAYEIL